MKINNLKNQHAEDLAGKLKRLLKRGPVTLAELSSKFDRGIGQIKAVIQELQAAGFNCNVNDGAAEISKDLPAGGTYKIDPKLINGRTYRFGAVGDSHLGSKYARLDVLNAVYDRFAAEGVKDVYHAGNYIDGECRFNRFDLLPGAHTLEGQLAIMARDYPQRQGITTHYIAGDDHEGWYTQREGINIGQVTQDRITQAGRSDLHYLGYLEATVVLPAPKGKTEILLMHAGGGTAYATSYNPQKIAESFQGGEKPDMVLIGHYHKADFTVAREVLCFQVACTQDQTPFMRKKRLQAMLGGWIIEITQADNGHIARCKSEYLRFYGKGFYLGEPYSRW